MKALLLIDDDKAADIARFYLKPLGFEAIRYRNPLKAIDNLDEIEPDAVILSVTDYPRHWKVIAADVRSKRSKEDCVLILLKGERFPFEEAAKAAQLGVNGVVRDDLQDKHEQLQFQKLLKRYMDVEDSRSSERIAPSPWDRLEFMFSHPQNYAPVVGIIEEVSEGGLSFLPESATLTADLVPDDMLEDCSLRAGDRILSLHCRVARAGRSLGLAITEMDPAEKAYFIKYLKAFPEREMNARLKKE